MYDAGSEGSADMTMNVAVRDAVTAAEDAAPDAAAGKLANAY